MADPIVGTDAGESLSGTVGRGALDRVCDHVFLFGVGSIVS